MPRGQVSSSRSVAPQTPPRPSGGSGDAPPSRPRTTRSRSRRRGRPGTVPASPELAELNRWGRFENDDPNVTITHDDDDEDDDDDDEFSPKNSELLFETNKAQLMKAFREDQLLKTRLAKLQGKRFALIRDFSVADFLTLANAICGALSIFLCLNYLENARYEPYLGWAFVLLPLALIFDILDGKVARMTHSMSPYGADLDSLADLISFGVAPAVMGFALGLRGVYDSLILVFSICCGLSRLARFNVTANILSGGAAKVKYYEGLPIPGNLINVVWLFALWWNGSIHNETFWLGRWEVWPGHFHPFSLFYLITGYAMIAQFKIPKP